MSDKEQQSGDYESQVRTTDNIPDEELVKANRDGGGDDDGHGEGSLAADDGFEAVRRWRVAVSLNTLLGQVNAMAPGRSKASDGSIGDPAHQSRNSDHNPWIVDGGVGVVTARDFTHDPAHGCDANQIAEKIRASRDPRVKYIIWNRRIASSSPIGGVAAWEWRRYTGANGHTHHVHLSVKSDKANYDSAAPWAI